MSAVTVTTTPETPHVWVHPRDRKVLGVLLRDLKHEVDRELLRSLAYEKTTAPVWPVLQAIGASDAQIDGVLRFPGPRCDLPGHDSGRPAVHWHWRTTFSNRGETQFWLRSKLQLGGPELVACVRRLLQIPGLEPSTSPAPVQAPAPGLSEAEYADLAKSWQRQDEPVQETALAGDEEEELLEAEPERGGWWVMGAIGEPDDPMTPVAAQPLVEGLAGRRRAQAWLRMNHAQARDENGYDCYYIDGSTDDAPALAAECWRYDGAGNLVSDKDGRTL